MTMCPEPHPLDYDWRFSKETVRYLSKNLQGKGNILSVGSPTVARFLEARGETVLLVDRQPIQGVKAHLVGDVFSVPPLAARYDVAVIDPPWYPYDIEYWASWAARSVGVGKKLLVTIWPDNARPRAAIEKAEFLSWLTRWSTFEVIPSALHYLRPKFEQIAMTACDSLDISTSPRFGDLIYLVVNHVPDLPRKYVTNEKWHRFVLNNYQLALRINDSDNSSPAVLMHPDANNWLWPYVSKRAPGRDRIDLWSSRGEVAIVNGSRILLQLLRRAIQSSLEGPEIFRAVQLGNLGAWTIPTPPYNEAIEWTHQQ